MEAPVFHPSREEFASFATYIRTVVEPKCINIGLCKIVPPSEWFIRSYDDIQFKIHTPLSQHVAGKKGIFHVDLVERKSMNVQTFQQLAQSMDSGLQEPFGILQYVGEISNDRADFDEVERLFWKGLRSTMDPPVYGADLVGSLFGDHPSSWNVNNLDTILRSVDLPGVTQAMLYFGMWRAMFAMHTEDMDLYSINYLHSGKPKFWYGVPPQHSTRLERLAQGLFPEKYMECHQFLRHKTSMIAPSKLRDNGIPYYKTVHRAGEFVITFPHSYHQGFNLGFNIAESVNFATLRWISFGKVAKLCKCIPDSVTIDMDSFIHQLFLSKHSHTLDPEAWVLNCSCGKFSSSADPDPNDDLRSFECSNCKVWVHLVCRYPELSEIPCEALPSLLYCQRCSTPPSTDSLNLSKDQCVKNATFVVQRGQERVEAKVVAVDGSHLRLHYKGTFSTEDEWIAVNDCKLLDKTGRKRSSSPCSPKKHKQQCV